MATHLKKFRPDRAIEILQSRERTAIFKTLALAELMSWMALDQRQGKRHKPPVFSRRHALLARNVVIVSLLVRQYQGKKDRSTILKLLELFLTSGGFELFLKAPRSPKGWLSKLRKSVEIAYVHEVASYLCRYKKYEDDPKKGTVQYAKHFVVDPRNRIARPGTTSVVPRTVGKYWETNKQAAPYIFAFYKSFADTVRRAKSIDEMVDQFAEQSAN